VRKKAVTIRDVARRASVSVATASRALNGNEVVNAGTRDRILLASQELGFTPSALARRLSIGRTLTIGVVVMFLTRPQSTERLRGVDAVLADSEFDLIIHNVESLQSRDRYLGPLARSPQTDGLLVMSLPPPEGGLLQRGTHLPVVFIDVHTASVSGMPRVVGDDVHGGALAARHLLALGHRDVAFIGDEPGEPFGFTSSRDRHAGFARELADAGVVLPPARIGLARHGRYEARELAVRMLTGEAPPTAIFAASDTQALGVLAAAREAGLRVPDDLSIVGYDDIETADYAGLTTIRQQLFESGRRGAELLLAEIERPSSEVPVITLSPELVVRATTAPTKGGT
jgi:DNA-binding LacI/PurR family transcriptional regulator